MFERYSEKARRTIFWARSESIQLGTSEISPEHILLALFREGTLADTLTAEIQGSIRREIEETHAPQEKQRQSSPDVPLSHSAKRVLAYAAEEAERMNHTWIGTEHLLVGLLREPSLASRILAKNGEELDSLRKRFAEMSVPSDDAPLSPEEAKAARDQLRALIESLPDRVLAPAHGALLHLQHGQLRKPLAPPRVAELRAEWRERMRETGGSAVGFMGAGPMPVSIRLEGRAAVFETLRFYHGHEITIVERIELADDGRVLKYSQQILGPKNKDHSSAVDFDIS